MGLGRDMCPGYEHCHCIEMVGGYQGKITWERQRSLGVNSSLLMPVSTALTLYSATSAAATTPCGVSHLNTFEPDKGGWRGRWYAYVPAP